MSCHSFAFSSESVVLSHMIGMRKGERSTNNRAGGLLMRDERSSKQSRGVGVKNLGHTREWISNKGPRHPTAVGARPSWGGTPRRARQARGAPNIGGRLETAEFFGPTVASGNRATTNPVGGVSLSRISEYRYLKYQTAASFTAFHFPIMH